MSLFQKNKYVVVKKAIDKNLASFLYNYLIMKKQVARTCFDYRYISPFEDMLGTWSDTQIPNTYSAYSDIAMETLMLKCQPIMEKTTGFKLYPAYSYARIYKKGDELKRHKDRFSCEVSTTLNLGGDDWPIYLEPSGKDGKKGTKIILKPGDMLVYYGCDLEHWREPFKGTDCAQVFLHYNNQKTKGSKQNMFDGRAHLGLPNWFKR